MQQQLENLLTAIKDDYAKMQRRWIKAGGNAERLEASIVKHGEELGYKVGKKYIKITEMNGGSAWGFVVNSDDDPKFKKGDILKAASWSAPAKNQARGNVLDGDFSWVRWTGPEYLR
jgi:hypothetical protein|tara:strand:+ start:2217 stop:2567 length:351 start_codon:yes stop_codon:yes gene_type:complete